MEISRRDSTRKVRKIRAVIVEIHRSIRRQEISRAKEIRTDADKMPHGSRMEFRDGIARLIKKLSRKHADSARNQFHSLIIDHSRSLAPEILPAAGRGRIREKRTGTERVTYRCFGSFRARRSHYSISRERNHCSVPKPDYRAARSGCARNNNSYRRNYRAIVRISIIW